MDAEVSLPSPKAAGTATKRRRLSATCGCCARPVSASQPLLCECHVADDVSTQKWVTVHTPVGPVPLGWAGTSSAADAARPETPTEAVQFSDFDFFARGSFSRVVRCSVSGARAASGEVVLKQSTMATAGEAKIALREWHILSGASRHPAVVDLLYAYSCEHRLYLVEESLPGTAAMLIDCLRGVACVPPPYRTAVVRDTAAALAYLHAAGVAHRDVKPSNILFCPRSGGRAKLADFGSARLLPQAAAGAAAVCGSGGSDAAGNADTEAAHLTPLRYRTTEPYRPPEAEDAVCGADGRGPTCRCRTGRYDEGVDVWGLGCVLYELLSSGETLWRRREAGAEAETVAERVRRVCEGADETEKAALGRMLVESRVDRGTSEEVSRLYGGGGEGSDKSAALRRRLERCVPPCSQDLSCYEAYLRVHIPVYRVSQPEQAA